MAIEIKHLVQMGMAMNSILGLLQLRCTRSGYVDIQGLNCQGDELSNNRVNGNTGFNNDCFVKGNCFLRK